MDLAVFGLNFKTSSIEKREACTIPADRMADFLKKLSMEEGVRGVVYVATCNRVEIYAALQHRFSFKQFSPAYAYFNEEAFAHLLRVACGLDSLVLGENEIFGQVKRAYLKSLELKTAGPLHFVFQKVFQMAKKIRTETGIARSPSSIATVALLLLEQIFGEWNPLNVLVIGLGEMGKQTARLLDERGVQKLYIMNRRENFAKDFASSLSSNVEILALDSLKEILPKVDIVVTATASPHYVLTKGMPFKQDRFQVLIDLSTPRDVEPGLGRLENIYLYNVDDLKAIAEKNLENRLQEARVAEEMIKKYLPVFEKEWFKRVEPQADLGRVAQLVRVPR